ncbi:MAG: hypothetical protein GPJ23_08650, partial [Microcystis aeruginosa G13-05]|nr:hypothetical protein [Microcystis aeruginosa G13-05]
PSSAAGSGYLLLRTDAFNYQTESNENDNVYAQAIDIAVPNLIITNVTAPTTASASQSLTLSWTGKNDSSVTTGSSYWYDRVVFSKNNIYGDSDDIYLTERYISSSNGLPLEPNETYTASSTVTLPVQAVGSGYLLFRTDVYNYQVESNKNDNVYAQAIDIAAPNLIITSGTAPSNGILGQSISVSWTVLNNGTVSADADWYDSVYLSNDQTWDSGDTWITAFWEAARSPLAANTSYTDTQNITIPSNAGTGDKYLIFVTDQYSYSYNNQQGETNENDNTYAVPITLGAPDLIISGATAPSSGVVNGAINVSWTVKNQGTTDAPADWYDVIYLSSDNIPGNGNDSYIAEQFISTQTPLAVNGTYTINRSINLPNVTPGNYYIFFRADAYNYQGETNENNNYSQAIAITIGAPDLIVSNATAPESGALGGTVSLSWTVQNQGTVEAPADWTDYIYWSSNDTYDGSDTFITSISAAAQTPVAAGGSYSKTQNITLPNQINLVGNGYLIVRADGNNAQGETNENNNNLATPIRIDAPDLIVSNATAPASVTIGATISVTWDAKNQGTVAANADWYDRVVISTDQIFGNSDDTYLTEVWQGSFTPLAAGATYSRTLNVTLPSTATGDRYLLFKADNYNYQGETDENNNVYSLPINISASDLQVTATNAPTSAILGETVELTWTVTNNGTGEAPRDWYDRVYLSSNQTVDSGDVQVTWEWVSSQTPLAAGASYTISKNVTLPSFTPGNQYLLFVADRDNYQGEINENNNLAAVAISLTAPDLIVSNASVPATGTVGKSIEVSWTVQNQGTSAAPTDWSDRIYLSNDAIFDANADTYITQELISTQTPLAGGASYSITRNINLPNFATGNRYLIFVADGSGGQGETNETNNTRAVAINLNAPDLVVSDITAPVETLSGQPIEINWTVKNQGSATAEGTWYDYVSLVNTATNATQYVGIFEYSGSLAAGASLNRTQSYSVPLSLTGNYRVVVTTDYSGNIAEGTQNESNNTTTDDRSISLQLAPVPNLQVTGVTAPTTAFSSQETVVQWTVKNVGTGATNAPVWYDRVYLSLDTTYDNTDTYLGDAVNPSYLNPNDSYSNSLTVTLPRGIDGNYYFLVQADVYNYVTEVGNEGDNWGSGGPTDVNLTPPPDLQVTAVNAPNGAFSGQPMNLSWTVTNAGTGRTLETAWYDRVFMSADATLDAGDRFLGDFYHSGALNAGANYTGSATVNLPIGVAGSFFFFVQSDIYNNVYEHVFENNNSGYDTTATNITLTPPPDLEFESLTIPNNARSGSNLSINYRVTNFGATETPNYYWTDTFYLSSDNQLNTATDINLGSVGRYGVLYPGDGYDRTANFSLPNTLTGTYYVFGVTDSGDQVFELNNVNNVTQSTNQVQIVSQPADLVVTDAIIPTTGEAGKTISVQWTVKNQGPGDTIVNSWSDRLVASNDEVLGDADDLTLASFTRTGLLAPNGTYSRTESVTLPFTLEGNYQLFVVTDSANSVYEGSNEGNNTSSAFPITISRDTPDLQVTSITLPNTVTPGQPLTLSWTVANLGIGRTNSNYWYDQVYLSLDKNVSSNDINLGSVYRSGTLEPSASYSATGTFSLPVNLDGSYYVLVQTDRDNNVIEGAFENNNVLASDSTSGGGSGTGSLPITPAPSADLAVTAVDAPEQGIAGQSLSLTWTVVNNDANTGQSWYDAVYLSRDQVFDRNSDVYLGYRNHTGGLNAGDSYTATQSFNIPRGLGGRFYAFVVTDGGNAVYERLGEINNVNYDGFSTEIILPPPVDLVVGTITIPVNGTPGQNATISYTVNNQSTNEAIGTWEDTIYLSSDNQWDVNDAFFGRVSQTGPVAGGGSYSKTVTATLPGVATGDYYVIVRSDIRNYIPESNEANNIKASLDDFAVDVESLELGTPDTGTLGQGQSVYYRVDVPAGETLLLNFDSQSTAAANELYIRYGDIPSRGQFDIGYSQPFSPDQEIVIPSTRGGTYYVLAYGDNVTGVPANYSIEAELLEFSLRDIGTTRGSNKGQVTLTLEGAKLTPTTTAKLIAADGTERIASQIIWKDSTETWATFNLQGLETGIYDVQIADAQQTFTLDDSFTVTNGPVGYIDVQLGIPNALRPGQQGIVTVNYTNRGQTDIVAPLIEVTAELAELKLPEQSNFGGSSLQFLGINTEGAAGILSPGMTGNFSLVFRPTVTTGIVNISTNIADKDKLIDWDAQKSILKPDNIPNEAWDTVWNNFIQSVGNTTGSYQQVLADNATRLSQLGDYIADVSQLLNFEIAQASDYEALPQLYILGSFGRGRSFIGDIQLIQQDSEHIIIQNGNTQRHFHRQSDGTYLSESGASATITNEGGFYKLQSSDGEITAFLPNGRLNYIQSPNGTTITAEYTNGILSSLVSSDGESLTFTYNEQNRISTVTDQRQRTTNYSYDPTGQLLTNITDVTGTTTYTYNDNYALTSITRPDNTKITFEYDSQGRLIRESLGESAESITYKYDSIGGVIATDANGSQTLMMLNDRGQIAQLQDSLGRVTQLYYDVDGNLSKTVNADNTASVFTYNEQGQITSQTDALGQIIQFAYEPNYGLLTKVTDARGNAINYSYDTQGKLRSIDYGNNISETFDYDSQGNVIRTFNRRDQQTTYTYDEQGVLQRQSSIDGSFYEYTYDGRGNIQSVTDLRGTTYLEYDAADRITKITDTLGNFLSYTYDTAGRRTSMVDQSGNTVNYHYENTAGRLIGLTDGNNNPIITYAYDEVGRLAREDKGNGTYVIYNYYADDRVQSLVNYKADGSVNSSFYYTYDSAGRQSEVTTLDGQWSYTYDSIGQLTNAIFDSSNLNISDRNLTYFYDAAGNRIRTIENGVTTEYTTNNLNQYLAAGITDYQYDADGNLISKTIGDQTWSYSYNARNHLISVIEPNGNQTQYEYDVFGDRVATIYNGQRTQYLIDPFGLGNVVGEYDDNNNLIARYIHGLGLETFTRADGQTGYYDFNDIGSTVGITGTNGQYLNRYVYQPFGQEIFETETLTNPFEFVGQWGVMEEANGLDFMRARYYDSLLGRFTATDPLGIEGGINLYSYTQNNPISAIDPSGELPVFLIPALVGLGTGIATDIGIQLLQNGGRFDCIDWGSVALSGGLGALFGSFGPSGAIFGRARYLGGRSGILNRGNTRLGWSWNGPARSGRNYFTLHGGQPGTPGHWHHPGGIPGPANSYPVGEGLVGGGLGGGAGRGINGSPDCDDPEPPEPPTLPGNPGPGGSVPIIRPSDPNDIVGPAGFGDENWIASQTLPYTIRFENQASATAPAQTVYITHPLDSDVDFRTFRLGSFGWSGLTFNVPENRSFYNQRVDLTEEHGFLVDVFAGIDIQKGEAFWTLTTIDPETGETPENPLIGFLPPNNEDGVGDGFVTYSIRPSRTAETGDVIDAVATIIFDTEEPISTPPIFNTLDVDKPSSEVNDLPATTATPEFLVSWTGTDTGSALATYTIYVSDNGGNYTVWLDDTELTEATYTGTAGHTYSFYSVAVDNTGNTEAAPTTADATIQIGGAVNQPPQISVNTGLTLNEGANSAISNSLLAVADPDNTADQLTFTISTIPTNGNLQRNGVTLAVNNTFTQADINSGLLSYIHNGGETTSDSFSFTVADGAGGNINVTSFVITVNPVDDAPTVLNPITDVNVDEDAENSVINLSNVFTDIDNDIALIVKSVFVNDNPGLVTATIVNNQLTLDYQDNQSGIANITIRGTSNGKTVDDTLVVTVNPVDDAP